MRTEILDEIQFHAESLKEGVISLDDFRQAVDEILDHNLKTLISIYPY